MHAILSLCVGGTLARGPAAGTYRPPFVYILRNLGPEPSSERVCFGELNPVSPSDGLPSLDARSPAGRTGSKSLGQAEAPAAPSSVLASAFSRRPTPRSRACSSAASQARLNPRAPRAFRSFSALASSRRTSRAARSGEPVSASAAMKARWVSACHGLELVGTGTGSKSSRSRIATKAGWGS